MDTRKTNRREQLVPELTRREFLMLFFSYLLFLFGIKATSLITENEDQTNEEAPPLMSKPRDTVELNLQLAIEHYLNYLPSPSIIPTLPNSTSVYSNSNVANIKPYQVIEVPPLAIVMDPRTDENSGFSEENIEQIKSLLLQNFPELELSHTLIIDLTMFEDIDLFLEQGTNQFLNNGDFKIIEGVNQDPPYQYFKIVPMNFTREQ
ncbi:MAG: hypothetical protein KatS3mg085_484 [Candidatus Dojkabacteria bacterium]|nr:MAG: hypothetical protein KatS3mg085_484 [Candidatus Dojkabacteria bacterium]